MRITEYIYPEYFLGALVVGMIIAIWHKPEDVVIVKHPTPFNDQTKFKHSNGDCYKYLPKKAQCSKDAIKYQIQ